jgi:hypothetical protein
VRPVRRARDFETVAQILVASVAAKGHPITEGRFKMALLAVSGIPIFAAAGYSILYLLMGGGLGGAILIFFVAKMLGK